ncbi:LTA synthase family protein [Methylomarinum vadi]|uniref:LTA synthase family protein n=1 Tax=Methylomarinum vadi TaxID=438855 RepID=UPI00068BB1BA|nr:sulfatase-like hydrolase/transferase [Methylomarinum vadi]
MAFFLEIEKWTWRHRRFVVVLITILTIQFFELALLHIKYQIFTAGFLQPYSYRSWPDRFLFLFLSLWYDFLLCGLFASLWFYIADRLNKFGVLIYYNFTVLVLLLMGIWLGLRFKVLTYFNDTINYQIITNLGGGSLKDGLLYASNEIALFTGIMFLIILCVLFSTRFLKKHEFVRDYHQHVKSPPIYPWLLLGMVILTPWINYGINQSDFLRYGLQKKTAYRLVNDGLNRLTDFDDDGYGFFGYPPDSALFDGRIYPGALDIPNNDIDEDGFLGDADLFPLERDQLNIAPRPGKHIVLIVLETARYDLLKHKLNGQFVAPVLRSIAKTGTSVEYAYSHTGYTATSLTALFNRELIHNDNKIKMIEFLTQAGYQISIMSGQDESFGNVATNTGMNKKGNYYFDARTAIEDRVYPSKDSGSLRLSEERVVEQFHKHFQEIDWSVPQFIYMNFQAAHFPYSHPNMKKHLIKEFIPRSDIKPENRDWVADTYWNAIASADWAVGQVVDALKKNGLYDKTTLVILGDHGESLFEDGFLGHGHALNDAQTHIPLLFNDPNIQVQEAIGQSDVAEMAIRSALGLPNQWLNTDKTVFQLVGSFKFPSLIGHVKYGGKRTIFDFRSERVFLSDSHSWHPYRKLLQNSTENNRIISLIREWETLKWYAFDYARHQRANR